MKRNGLGLLVALVALTISGCTTTTKKKVKRHSSMPDSSESLVSSKTTTNPTTNNPTSKESTSEGTIEGTSLVPVSSASTPTSKTSSSAVTTAQPPVSTSVQPTSSSNEYPSSVVPPSSSQQPPSSSVTPPPSSSSEVTPSTSVTPPPSSSSEVSSSSSSGTTPIDNTYYASISNSLEGNDLLKALQSLNKTKKHTEVTYDGMGTTSTKAFKYTDYDPSTVQYDQNGQPYGTKIVSFYSGNTMTSFNREHVWPKSHGGNLVEDDIHMPRPTIPAENGSRGNSFYVEGMCDGTYGWDPAEEDFGDETYRGDSARIIFYCVVAESKLSLIESEYHQTSNSNRDNLMGKLSDMLKWNLQYPVLDREQRRNSGAEYLQGNRNPFIDHPEYACKIWGATNETTRSICGM